MPTSFARVRPTMHLYVIVFLPPPPRSPRFGQLPSVAWGTFTKSHRTCFQIRSSHFRGTTPARHFRCGLRSTLSSKALQFRRDERPHELVAAHLANCAMLSTPPSPAPSLPPPPPPPPLLPFLHTHMPLWCDAPSQLLNCPIQGDRVRNLLALPLTPKHREFWSCVRNLRRFRK